MSDLYQGKDPRNIGTYSATEAVHYLRVPYSTVRSWVFGTRYKTKLGSRPFQPVITIPEPNQRLLSLKRIEWDETDLLAKLYPFTRTKESELPRLIVINPIINNIH